MINVEEFHKYNFRADDDGTQWVCKGRHERSQDCEWELASAHILKAGEAVNGNAGGLLYNSEAPDCEECGGKGGHHSAGYGSIPECSKNPKPIDLYDTPIDLRPIPKQTPEEVRINTVSECIAYLRQHGDHYGAELLRESPAGIAGLFS